MTPQERLAGIKSQALDLKETIDSRAESPGVIPVETMENPAPELNLQTPELDPTQIDSTVSATQKFLQEQQAAASAATQAEESQFSSVRELQNQLLGRGQEQYNLEQQAGLGDQRKRLADLTSRISTFTEDLAQFDDETFLGEEAMRADASSRDITKGTFSAMSRERRLQRAITRTSEAANLRAMVASAQLMQNNITAAQDEITRAMDLKYGVVEQALEYENQYLDRLIAKSDGAQKEALEARKSVVAQQEQDVRDAKQMVQLATTSGATPEEVQKLMQIEDPQMQADASLGVLARIAREDRSLDIAQQQASIEASRASTYNSYVNANIKEMEFALAQEKQAQIDEAIANGAVILDQEQQDIAYKLGKDFESESSEFKKQVGAYNRIIASAEDPSAAGDLALIFNYMKMLDPGSTVREGEFANAQNSAGVPSRIQAQYNQLVRGERLTETQRNDFVGRSQKIYDASLEQQVDLENRMRDKAVQVFGLPENAADLIVQDIRATGAVSDVAFGLQMQNLTPAQIAELQEEGLIQ